MNNQISERVLMLAKHCIDTNDTVRKMASIYNISKSTVHYDLSKRLKILDIDLYFKCRKILNINFKEKHIRGGNATKKYYLNKNKI